MHGDKNEYGPKVAIMVGNYIDLFFEAKKLAFEHIPDQGDLFLKNPSRIS